MTRAETVIGNSEDKDIAQAATNSIVQAIAKELLRLGLKGGLGDDRGLRRVVHQIVSRLIKESVSTHCPTLDPQ